MPYIFLLLFSIFLTGCANNGTTSPSVSTPSVSTPVATTTPVELAVPVAAVPAGLPMTTQTTDIDDLKIAPENTIIGKYTLKRGAFSHGAIYQDITEGYLVIEELDVNNYGYYYVTIVNKMSPETHAGIFYEKAGKFVQKVIYNDENSAESKITTVDNINLTFDDNILKIIIDSTKKETTVWERDDGIISKSAKLSKALENAQQQYLDFYKNKCVSANIKCADREYTPVND